MATYSIGLTGALAENPARPLNQTVDDAVATPGAMASAMSLRTPFLAKGPDGAQAWYRYDAERSLPGGPRILLKV